MSHAALTPVSSSNIAALGYFSETLVVEFNSGSLYAYDNVPKDTYDRFKAASSLGQFLNSEIKTDFTFRQLTPADVDQLAAFTPAANSTKKSKKSRTSQRMFAAMVALNPVFAHFF